MEEVLEGQEEKEEKRTREGKSAGIILKK